MFEPRFYRLWSPDRDLVSFSVVIKQTDLYIRARRNLEEEARQAVLRERGLIEEYIQQHPGFAVALEPFPVGEDAPGIVKEMAQAASAAGVGPMAAVAGAIAERVGRALLARTPEVIVENGGDVFIKSRRKRLVGIYAGQTRFSGRLALEISPEDTPLGVCTSSGTVGHSLSLGRADAAVVLAASAALADAAATAIGNLVTEEGDIPKGLYLARGIAGLKGGVIIKGERLAVWGKVRLVPQ